MDASLIALKVLSAMPSLGKRTNLVLPVSALIRNPAEVGDWKLFLK